MRIAQNTSSDLSVMRHSAAHLLAAAVLELWPKAKHTIGPAIDNGFYYDFDLPIKISVDDLEKIEHKMREIAQTWKDINFREVSLEQAKKFYKDNPYKLELIDEIVQRNEPITLYRWGDFEDLCRGGHAQSAKDIVMDGVKLHSVAGAYWRGSEKRPMLTRIYGLAFGSKDELQKYRAMLEEAAKRDHKILGPKHELFFFHATAPGMPYWLPQGVALYNQLIDFWRNEHARYGYKEIVTPLLNKKDLYVTSGHFEHFWQDMFVARTSDEEEYGVKAMNCPNAMIVFGSRARSYRELPLRLSDTDSLHRNERSGVLNGLLRVREFRQDDAHIFVSEEQIGSEYQEIFSIVEKFYSVFGMEYSFRLGTRPENFMGDANTWERAEKTLRNILESVGKKYNILEGDGAFYGPKIDILMNDALGREWQMGTIQLDFQQPRRFELEYIAANGSRKTPIAIHRVIYGSLERFIGILIEHFAAAFPLWLSPVQTAILPVSEKFNAHACAIYTKLQEQGIRSFVDTTSESVGKKVRNAERAKIPYMLVIGEKEVAGNTLTVRTRGKKEMISIVPETYIARMKELVKQKSLSLELY